MPFKKGMNKVAGSGRKKGIIPPDKKTVREMLAAIGCDPIEGLARIAMDENENKQLRARCYTELAGYCWPKLRSIELSGPDGEAIALTHVSPAEEIARRIALIAARTGAAPDP